MLLALRRPDAEGNLGCAEEAHQVRVLPTYCDIWPSVISSFFSVAEDRQGDPLADVLLSAREGVLEIESVDDEEVFRISITHPEIEQRRMKDLERVLERFLDGYEITPTRAMLVKRLR